MKLTTSEGVAGRSVGCLDGKSLGGILGWLDAALGTELGLAEGHKDGESLGATLGTRDG